MANEYGLSLFAKHSEGSDQRTAEDRSTRAVQDQRCSPTSLDCCMLYVCILTRVSYRIFCWGGGGGGGGGDTWQPMQAPPPPIPSARSYHTQGCDQLTCFDMFRSGYVPPPPPPPPPPLYETLLTSDLCS